MSNRSFAVLVWTVCFWFALSNSFSVPEKRTLKKRSVISLGQMIGKVTGRSPVHYLNYGRWCGLGGEGDPVDPIDECCFKHDKCYDAALEGPCKDLKEHPVFLRYAWNHTEENGTQCDESNEECGNIVCGCDVEVTSCFLRNNETYNALHRGKKLIPRYLSKATAELKLLNKERNFNSKESTI